LEELAAEVEWLAIRSGWLFLLDEAAEFVSFGKPIKIKAGGEFLFQLMF